MTLELVDDDCISSYKRQRKYSDDELLEHLIKFEREEGRPPEARDFANNPDYPGYGVYRLYFGSWNNALQMAGLQTKKGCAQVYTDKELVDDNDISSCKRQIRKKPQRLKKYSDSELLEHLRKFEREEGRPPVAEYFNNNPKYPNFNTYIKRFGSWNKALQMAGLNVNCFVGLTNEELLEFIRKFEREEDRPPTTDCFDNNPKYPNFQTYMKRFGSWNKALKLVGLDIDSMVRKGIIETNNQKARLAEIFVLDHFAEKATDLSGENRKSFADGICPKNQIYDVKSSAFYIDNWQFSLSNSRRDDIEWLYLLGFNEDYSELRYAWRIPSFDFIGGDSIKIGISNNYTYNVENMKEYEITEKFKNIDFRFLNDTSEEKKEK